MMMRLMLFTSVAAGAISGRTASADMAQEMANESIERRRVTLLQPHQMGRLTLTAADGGGDPVRNDDDDDDKRPVLPPRLLKRTRDENDAKAKGSEDDPPSKMPSNAAGTAKGHAWHAGEELIHTPPPVPSPPSASADDAANFDVPGTATPPSSPPFASSAARGGGDPATASRGSSRQHKGKSRKTPTGVCNRRLLLAFNATQQIPDFFPDIKEPEDVTKLCSFVTPTSENERYNLGCPFIFIPANYIRTGVPKTNFFPKGVKEYVDLFQDLCGGNSTCEQKATAEAEALASVALYCSCYQGYDLGCSNRLPSSPQETDENCTFAGVWNGDFDSTDVELSRESNDCGCFWISQVTNAVGNCPGVDLGYFYRNFTGAKDTLSALSSHN